MKISKYLLVLVSTILLAGCAESSEIQTDESPNPSTTSFESKADNITSESTISNQIKNTSKLKFDNTITNIPDLTDVKSVEFERCDWTKTELTNSFVDAVNYFASSNNKKKIDLNDLSFSYIDSIEGDNRSGFAPTVMLIFIARSFPRSWRMDVRGSQGCCPHRSCCTLMRCYSIVKFGEGLYCPSLSSRWERLF